MIVIVHTSVDVCQYWLKNSIKMTTKVNLTSKVYDTMKKHFKWRYN